LIPKEGRTMSHISTAVFPVAGLGTRFLPITKSVPKEMLPLIDRPLIQYAVDEAREAEIENFVFVSSPAKPALNDYFRRDLRLEHYLSSRNKTEALRQVREVNLAPESHWVTYQTEALGLGHAIWMARAFIRDEAFAVILPDDFILSDRPAIGQMIEKHAQTGGNMVAAMNVPRAEISAYSCLDIEARAGRCLSASGIVEKPDSAAAPSTHAVIGRYILQASVLDRLETQAPGANGEIQLNDAIAADLERNMLWGYEFEGRRFDCGSKQGYVEATVALAQERADLALASMPLKAETATMARVA